MCDADSTDIKPRTSAAALNRERYARLERSYGIGDVAKAVGMSPTFIRKIVGKRSRVTVAHVLDLLDQDAFRETCVPRSRVIEFLEERLAREEPTRRAPNPAGCELRLGHAPDLIRSVPDASVQCVVTSTPYWGMRAYADAHAAAWADGAVCPYGHEQTPESFVRHTVEIIGELARVVTDDGSIWWNVMDSFNTRTQIRGSASEALTAMQGGDARSWGEHQTRRYSAGHSYLKDGEQCLIPAMIAERASRIGLWVKSMITWAKTSSLPEPQTSRVSRNLEYVIHMAKQRTPKFARAPYETAAPAYGGRDERHESAKLSDVWVLNTSAGGDGHGAQFPVSLPGRCIALTTDPGDLVLDPFVGSGNSGVAALHHGCRFLGFDVSPTYLAVAREKLGCAAGGR